MWVLGLMGRRVVARADLDVVLKVTCGELDVVKYAVMTHFGRNVEQLVLVALSGLDGAEVIVNI